MTAAINYRLCIRRLGNRSKGTVGATFTNLTVDGQGIITGLGTAAQLAAQDSTYRATPTTANLPPMRKGVNQLPVQLATFTLASSANFDGEDKYRLQRVLATLNQYKRTGARYGMGPDAYAPGWALQAPIALLVFKGVTSLVTTSSSGSWLGNQENWNIINTAYANETVGIQNYRMKKFEYFITNK